MLDSEDESRLVIAPKALRDVIEHFPFPRGPKADPKLIWKFDEEDVFLRGQEASFDSEGDFARTSLPFTLIDLNSSKGSLNRVISQCLRV